MTGAAAGGTGGAVVVVVGGTVVVVVRATVVVGAAVVAGAAVGTEVDVDVTAGDEAPEVVGAAKELGDDVQFVGINIRDASSAQAQAFTRKFDVDFPSFYSPSGEALLAFPGVLGLRTIPAFAVLDSEGRVAASIIGKLPSRQTLVDVTKDVVDETRDGPRNG